MMDVKGFESKKIESSTIQNQFIERFVQWKKPLQDGVAKEIDKNIFILTEFGKYPNMVFSCKKYYENIAWSIKPSFGVHKNQSTWNNLFDENMFL